MSPAHPWWTYPELRRPVIVVVTFGLALLLAGWWVVAPHTYMTLPQLRAGLATAIPEHAPVDRVLHVLDSMDVRHSTLGRDGLVTANFGTSWRRGLVHAEIFGTFRFDAQRRLDSLRLEEISTGP